MSTELPILPDPLKRSKRLPLLQLNTNPSVVSKKTYDSSLKRHTSLLNKLRKQFSLEAKESVLKEIDSLSLGKYAEEIVDACVEGITGLGGKGDVLSVVEILTRLSIRLDHSVFLLPLLTQLYALLAPPTPSALKALPAEQRDREEKERVSRQRGVLRVLSEAEVCGLKIQGGVSALNVAAGKRSKTAGTGTGSSEEKKDGGLVEEALKALLASDPIFTSLPLFASFLKTFGRLYLGSETKIQPLTEEVKIGNEVGTGEDDELVSSAVQSRLRIAFNSYYESLARNVQKGREKLQEQDLKNHEAYIKSGEIFEDRQQAYEKMTKEVERLMAGLTSLADLLHLPAPSFPALPPPKGSGSVLVLDSSTSANPYARSLDDIPVGGMWEDEEQRKFYEDIIDLADFVPGGFLGVKLEKDKEKEREKEKDGKEVEEIQDQIVTLDKELGDEKAGIEEVEAIGPEEDGEEITATGEIPESVVSSLSNLDPSTAVLTPSAEDPALPAGPLARLNAIFTALPEAVSKSVVDQLAVDFAIMNSKPSRKKVVKFLSSVPKNRSDLLPLYARFVAALDPYMPDVGKDLIAILDEEFRYLQRKRLVKELAEVRSKNIRYYSELAKFKVARPHTILHVFKVLVDDLAGANIECAALLLENCGRFLLRSEETGERMKIMLELLRRKQSAQHMDPRLALLLENAYYQCNPPDRPAVQQKERTPMDLFIRHLVHDVLLKKTVEKVLKLIRKLHWEDPQIVHILHKAFTKVWKLKFSNIGALAIVVYDLAKFHSDFTTGVVDQVLENIRAGLETNIFKHNQRRIATIKYLGELHFYRQVNSTIIFDTLWSLITFGHSEPLPVPGRSSLVDAADDYFRVRLICTLLETCGMCFDKGIQQKRLDQFLIVFQAYVMCKRDPPMDVDFMVSDTFDLIRPDLVPFKNMEEVGLAIDELLASQALQSTVADDEEERVDSGSESGDEDREEVIDLREETEEKEDLEEPPLSDDGSATEEDIEDDLVVRGLTKADGMTREEEDEFTKEFSRLLIEQADKKGDRKATIPVFDSAVPLMRRAHKGTKAGEDDLIRTASEDSGGNMKFMLLTKKGNKPQTRLMDIPADSALAINTRSNQMLDKLEQQQMKALVLNHDKRQEDSEKRAEVAAAARRGIRLKFVSG